MSVEVVVPFRGSCPHRERSWAFLRERYTWPVLTSAGVTASCASTSAWVKATAVREALCRASADVVVVADADCWTEGLGEAVAAVEMGAPWAVPHKGVYRLTSPATERFITGGSIDWARMRGIETTEAPYKGVLGGGFIVAPRETLLEVPMDPRFIGWGQEDQALGLALSTLAGEPHRARWPLVHLWHPEPTRLDRRWGSREGRELFARYEAANNAPDAMSVLMEEAHGHLRTLQSPDHDHSPVGA